MAYKITAEKLDALLKALCEGRKLICLEQANDQLHLVRADGWSPEKHTLGAYRPVEPLKSLVFQPREFLGSLTDDTEVAGGKEVIVVGAKNCDLSALRIHDYVFLSDPVDPYYKAARERTILVSCDCTDAREVCFCTAVNEQPYAKKGFDVNLSETSKGYVVESGSEKGEKLLKSAGALLEPADEAILKERDQKRADMAKKVADLAASKGLKAGQDYQAAIKKSEESDLWDDFSKDCVECGACNYVCCTCHCFLLADGMVEGKAPGRVKQWDSCLHLNFARVAGGANPRKHRSERLHNRFDKKFNFFPQVLKTYACDGCGRCAEACTGKIDIRDVLKRALDEV